MLKGLVLLVAMLAASGVALVEATGEDPNERPEAPFPTPYEIVSPEIVRMSVDAETLAALRDHIVRETGQVERHPVSGDKSVPSRRDIVQSWAVGRESPDAPRAVRTTTTFEGWSGKLHTLETVETPGHDTLVLLRATGTDGEPDSPDRLLFALRTHFTHIAAAAHPSG